MINLGLDPWEALGMGLEPETGRAEAERNQGHRRATSPTGRTGRLAGVAADHPRRAERDDDAAAHRVARRQDGGARGRQGDPAEPTVIADEAEERLEEHVRERVTDRVLREADIDAQVADTLARIDMPDADALAETITGWVGSHESASWSAGVDELAGDLARTVEP